MTICHFEGNGGMCHNDNYNVSFTFVFEEVEEPTTERPQKYSLGYQNGRPGLIKKYNKKVTDECLGIMNDHQ